MEVAIENIASLMAAGNLAVNQLMEHEAGASVIAKATSMEQPKWTTVMAKNVHHVVNRAMETLANAPKQEDRKFNPRFTGFKTKEGKIKKELV